MATLSRSLEEDLESMTTSKVVIDALKIYGSIYAICVTFYIILRPKFPLVFNYCGTIPKYRTPLSTNHYGHFEWIWKVFQIPDDQIFEHCGVDAIVFIRYLRFGMRLSFIGMINSIFLIPSNVFGCKSDDEICSPVTDVFLKIGLSNVTEGARNLVATSVAAYIFFGSAMYYLFHEFHWFTRLRHKFLRRRRPDNYTVYIAHIPKRYRSDEALLEYFRDVFSQHAVIDAKVAMNVPKLEEKIATRENVIASLQKAITQKEIHPNKAEPWHFTAKGEKVNSIDTYKRKLTKLNGKIANMIHDIKVAKEKQNEMIRIENLRFSIEEEKKNQHEHSTLDSSDLNLNGLHIGAGSMYMSNQFNAKGSQHDADSSNNSLSDSRPNGPTLSRQKSKRLLIVDDDDENDVNKVLVYDDQVAPSKVRLLSLANQQEPSSLSFGPTVDHHQTVPSNLRLALAQQQQPSNLSFGSIALDEIKECDEEANLSPPSVEIPRAKSTRGISGRRLFHREGKSKVSFSSEPTDLYASPPESSIMTPHKRNNTMVSSTNTMASSTIGSVKSSLKLVGNGMDKSLNYVGRTTTHAAKKSMDGVKFVAKNTVKVSRDSMVMLASGTAHVGHAAKDVAMKSIDNVKTAATNTASVAYQAGRSTFHMIFGEEDLSFRDAGFVSFSNLVTKAQVEQMIHHPKPFKFYVEPAPLPKDIFWKNVGIVHKRRMIGLAISVGLTIGLCLFWIIPMTFISSFSEVEELKKRLPFLETALENNPSLAIILAQLKPLLLIITQAIVPSILMIFCKYEGHIASTTLKAAVFFKLSIFLLVQYFFVQAITTSVLAEIDRILKDPKSLLEFLSLSIQKQGKSFIQYLLVQAFVESIIELLRIPPVILAFIRRFVGPRKTKEERDQKYLFLAPLTHPEVYPYFRGLSELVVQFMILFAYSCISPMVNFLALPIFILQSLTYRNQFIYVYPPDEDTGGQLWSRMVKLIITCMFIAEVTLTAILASKKGPISVAFMIPLIIITFLFTFYIQQQHFRVTQHLPTTLAKREDERNDFNENYDYSFLVNQYLQPAMNAEPKYPSNMRENSDELAMFHTPTNSIQEDNNDESECFTVDSSLR